MAQNPASSKHTVVDPKRITAALRVAFVTMGAAVFQAILFLYYALTLQAWQMTALTVIVMIFGVFNIISLRSIRKGQIEAGAWPIIIGVILVILALASLVSNVATVSAINLIILTLVISTQTLPTKKIRPLFFASLLLGGLTASLDFLNLNYRLFVPAMQFVVSGITVGMILAIFFFVIPQATSQIKSLQLKIALWTGSIIVGVLILVTAYTAITGRQTAINNAQKEALAIASAQAEAIRVQAEIPLNTARAMAQSLTALKDPSYPKDSLTRDQVNAMLRQILIENPDFLGTYTLWEPNAFDGLDADYKNTDATDATGRFIPYWVRGDNNSVDIVALIDYETPGAGDWYIVPRQTKKEVTIAPLIYPLNGVDTTMASFIVPIVYNDKFYGITGVDMQIGFVQKIVDDIDLYSSTAESVLFNPQGTLIGVHNKPELANQSATAIFPDFAELQERVQAGTSFISISPDGKYLRVFAPVDLGETGEHWSFALLIPFSEITAPATATAIQQSAIGLVLILLSLAVLWFLSGQLVSPVRELTTVANAVSQGNLNIRSEVHAADETGALANAFNLMISQLRESFATLEQRVADRTRGLELASTVGRTVSQVRALDILLTDAAEVIRSQFDLYYVQVYLTNPSQTALLLQAGTGTVGIELLSRTHQLPLNTASINGRAAVEKQSIVISDTTSSATFKPNPLLPDTRSEMAVPLLIGERVVGVLDMQSREPNKLNKEGLSAFEALAGQLAIAIQNATLFAQAEQARAEVEAQARRQSRANWNDYLDAIHKPKETGFVFEKNKIAPMSSKEQSRLQTNEHTLSAPIEVIGESLGSLMVEMEGQSPISRTEELINTVAHQVAQQIESLRLLESAERYRIEAEEASRLITHEGWQEYMQANPSEGISYMYDLNEVKPYHRNGSQQSETTNYTLPLKVRDEIIGKFVLQGLDTTNSESIELANAVAERLGAHIEGLRLSNQTAQALLTTQKLAEREQALRQITNAVRGSTDPATILRSAARELGTILGRKTVIRLTAGSHSEESIPHDDENAPFAAKSPSQES